MKKPFRLKGWVEELEEDQILFRTEDNSEAYISKAKFKEEMWKQLERGTYLTMIVTDHVEFEFLII